MFGLNAKRRTAHYREAMRQLQPFATETNALRLSHIQRRVMRTALPCERGTPPHGCTSTRTLIPM
jgi:hypothetical protein